MKELIDALAGYPLLQGVGLGFIVAGIGVWTMRRGLQNIEKSKQPEIDEAVATAMAHRRLEHITDNSFDIKNVLDDILIAINANTAALNRIADTRWNRKQ